MMEQQRLIVEDIYQALYDACRIIHATAHPNANGKGWAQTAGVMLWPEKSPEEAGRLLSHCLDRNRPEKLDPEQVLFVARKAREVNCHVVMAFIAQECLYRPPEPVTPEELLTEKQSEFVEAVKTVARITQQISAIVKQ